MERLGRKVRKTFGARGSSEAGSVLVGVLVATVFLGIVAAAMLKNTAHQSAGSAAYSAVSTGTATVSSGAVATESYFMNGISPDAALKMLDEMMAQDAGNMPYRPYIYGLDRVKARLADDQFFSSRLTDFDSKSLIAGFDIRGGRSAGGRDLKRALAFYEMGNIKIESAAGYNGKNAVYMKGALVNGDNGMEVFGNATFEAFTKFQNSPGIFHGEAFFNGNAEFMHTSNKFYGKAYIGGNAVFQNMNSQAHVLFEDAVGFNGNLSTGNSGTLSFAGDVYVGGDFKSQYGGVETNVNLKGVSLTSNGNFYYTDKLSVYNPPATGKPQEPHLCSSTSWQCALHPGGHADLTKVTGFASKTEKNGMTPESMLSSLGMGALETRRDPQLDVGKIDQSVIQSAYSAATNNSAFSVKKLHESYDKAKADGKLYEDHLVLKVKRNDPMINFNEPHDAKFGKKVIFIIEDGATLNPGGRFYHSGESSSTLIYAGAGNAKLEQLGSGGLFRGLVYVDSLNRADNSFNWKAGSSVEGAIHVFGDKDLRWNTGSSTPTKVSYNEDVLKEFGALVKGGSGTGRPTAAFVDDTDKRIHLRPAGFYYF